MGRENRKRNNSKGKEKEKWIGDETRGDYRKERSYGL